MIHLLSIDVPTSACCNLVASTVHVVMLVCQEGRVERSLRSPEIFRNVAKNFEADNFRWNCR